ncbi:MAG TPA: VWA domain-containing protein [Anaerolineales bacterium]|nr:VWA domain-containing protein [Anaerolineales bacterium]
MSFIWPAALLSLIFVPVLVGIYVQMQRRRQRIRAQYGNMGFVQNTSGRRIGAVRHIPPLLMLAGLSILMLASARPQTEVALPRVEGTIILAFDVSGSMAATDLQPTRIDAAKAAARAFVDKQPSTVQVGIVAFSDSGFSVQAPTNDKDQVLASINRLSPQKGTSLANGMLASLKVIQTSNEGTHFYSSVTPDPNATSDPGAGGQYTSSVVVLLTDGENNEQPDPLAAAQAAAKRSVRIYTVGIGSPEGATLHINGFTVHTQLDEPTLQQIAQITGGTYFNAISAQDLSRIYSNLDPELIIKPEKTEITSIFAGASAAILLIGGLLSLFWFSRLP